MVNLENMYNKKIVSYLLISIFFITCMGFFNNSWYSLLLYQMLFLLFYSAKINYKKRNWLVVAVILLCSLLIKQSLNVPQIEESSNVFIGGENYKNSVFKKNLPSPVFDKLNNDFKDVFPNSISGPDNKVFYKSVSQMLYKSNGTRSVESINWNNRYQLQLGAFNNTKYNAFNDQEPNRENLPYFIKYSFPYDYSNSNAKFCWEGLAFIGNKLKKQEFNALDCIDFSSISIQPSNSFEIWLVETGKTKPLKAKLILPLKYKIIILLKHLFSILSGLIIFILLFKDISKKKSLIFLSSLVISILFTIYFYPNFLNKFVIFEGGNDGLLYVHFAHLISEHISYGNYKLAFMGGEKAYDLMPFYRYVWVINYFLFEESPWMLIFIITFFPSVIYKIFFELLGKKWSIYFIIFWFFIPFFEAFGFFHFYYVKLTLRGFGEPLSYLCFLTSLLYLIKFYKNCTLINYTNTYIFSLLLALSIGLRANILPACLIMLIFYILLNYRNKKNINYFFLILGFSIVLVMPIHNYMFTGKFIPLTIAAYKDWNLGARPSDYIILFKSLITLNFDIITWKKIIGHVHGEIKLYEIWYHLSIIICFYYSLKKKSPLAIRCIALSALSLISLLLFYHVGGRYSYLAWTLGLMVLSYWFKYEVLPCIKKFRQLDAT